MLNLLPTIERPRAADTAPPVRERRLRTPLPAVVVFAALVLVIAVLAGGGSAQAPPATGAAAVVPGDALAYVSLSIDPGRPAVKRATALAGRFPDYPLLAAGVISRLGAILSGGQPVDFATDIRPWLGKQAALALLNTATSTAGSLIVLDVSGRARAKAFLARSGAAPRGTYRGVALLGYPSGTEMAFVHGYLVLGQDASVRAAVDVGAGAGPSLQADPVYQRAAAGEPAGRVLDAYASVAGVRRVLGGQSGLTGALGALLYQPALLGVSVSVSAESSGALVQVHRALDPMLARVQPAGTGAFAPTLADVTPAGSTLMLDVKGLARVAPRVLSAVAAVGVAGGVGPLLSRLGAALGSEGVNVPAIVSIFGGETALGIVPHAQAPTLIIVARTRDEMRTRTDLAELELPLSQLFPAPSSGPGGAPTFNDRQVDGVTAHQLSLTPGLQLDYAVFKGLVVVSTSLAGIADVVHHQSSLNHEPAYRATLGQHAERVTSLLFLDFTQLLRLAEQTGLTSSARLHALQPDLQKIRAVGLSSTSGEADSTAELSLQIP